MFYEKKKKIEKEHETKEQQKKDITIYDLTSGALNRQYLCFYINKKLDYISLTRNVTKNETSREFHFSQFLYNVRMS